jgi:hypothetical protein
MLTNPWANAWCWWWFSSCSGGWSSFSHCRGVGSVPGQSMLYLWWTEWHWTGFSQEILFSPVSIIPTILHAHSFIYHWHYIILAADSICCRTYLKDKEDSCANIDGDIDNDQSHFHPLYCVCNLSCIYVLPLSCPVSSFICPHHSVLGPAGGSGVPKYFLAFLNDKIS